MPELLPNDPDTVALHAELLQGQEDTIEELKERAAAGLGIGGGADEPMLASLAASIYKMEGGSSSLPSGRPHPDEVGQD